MARGNPYKRPDAKTKEAKKLGFPARSVFKLEEIDRRARILGQGQHVLDLGASPGSWAMYAAQKIGGKGKLLAVDLKLPNGQQFNATGLQVVDEAKLRELPPDTAAELLRNGLMLLLHAHLLSSGNVQRLGERLAARLGAAGASAAKAPAAA